MNFLIVDDSSTVRRILSNALEQIGYESVIEAENGEEALETLAAEDVDFLITDWNMPGVDGLELIRQVRRSNGMSDMPILMVTTRGMEEDVIKAMKAQVDNYIVKPFTPDVLEEKIDTILSES